MSKFIVETYSVPHHLRPPQKGEYAAFQQEVCCKNIAARLNLIGEYRLLPISDIGVSAENTISQITHNGVNIRKSHYVQRPNANPNIDAVDQYELSIEYETI